MKQKYKNMLAAVALAAGLYGCIPGCAPNARGVINPAASNVGIASLVKNAGIDLDNPQISSEAIQKVLQEECDVSFVTDFYNTSRSAKETIISCDHDIGNENTENRWRLNVNSICNLLYRDNSVLGLVDVDMLKQDELYIALQDGTAFSLTFDEDAARSLAGLLSAYIQPNLKDCVDVAHFEVANYTPVGILQGADRIREQERYAAWVKENGSPKYALRETPQKYP